jgi:hypothetical protein
MTTCPAMLTAVYQSSSGSSTIGTCSLASGVSVGKGTSVLIPVKDEHHGFWSEIKYL